MGDQRQWDFISVLLMSPASLLSARMYVQNWKCSFLEGEKARGFLHMLHSGMTTVWKGVSCALRNTGVVQAPSRATSWAKASWSLKSRRCEKLTKHLSFLKPIKKKTRQSADRKNYSLFQKVPAKYLCLFCFIWFSKVKIPMMLTLQRRNFLGLGLASVTYDRSNCPEGGVRSLGRP